MEFAEMLSIIWRTKWIIILTAVTAGVIVGVYSWQQQTTYTAQAILNVGDIGTAQQNDDVLAANYANLVNIREVLEFSRQFSDTDVSASSLAGVSAQTNKDSPLVILSAQHTDPKNAINKVNTVARGLTEYVADIQEDAKEERKQKILEEISKIDDEISDVKNSVNADQSRIQPLDEVRRGLIQQFVESSVPNVNVRDLSIVSLAQDAPGAPSHKVRNTGIAVVAGLVIGMAAGFLADSIRKALASKY